MGGSPRPPLAGRAEVKIWAGRGICQQLPKPLQRSFQLVRGLGASDGSRVYPNLVDSPTALIIG